MTLSRSLLLSIAALLTLSGCYREPGLVEDTSYDRTKTGVATGALAGAIIGYNTKGHDKGQRALIGGLLGAAVGGAIGYSMDEQANAIARALGTGVNNDPLARLDPNHEIIVSKYPTHVRIMFRDKMMFATDSARLQPRARRKVQKIAQVLANYPQTVVGVAGFTDDRGSYEYNLGLSERRARSVANLLAVNGRPLVKGCSYNKPIVPNTNARNRALNRRVEVYLYADRNAMTDPCR
ncbi:OmpA family protein [Sulfurovum sp. ST-21]|uniref:OmpA family protein n=1 Tax=Sulfurovum indicum TaxID=2779528 RepID=A0A7M1S5G3_9BACT|nr:OmpA family protein [Sulfurovum indicum]QOR61979.1 OmpA family protein [Sulfurovum indicum]